MFYVCNCNYLQLIIWLYAYQKFDLIFEFPYGDFGSKTDQNYPPKTNQMMAFIQNVFSTVQMMLLTIMQSLCVVIKTQMEN